MTFIEACRAFKAVTGKLPLPITMMIEGEEECGSQEPVRFRARQCRRVQARPGAGLRHRHVGRRRRRRSPPRCAGWSTRTSRSPAPTATCIPACSAARRRTRSGCWPRFSARMRDDNGRVTIPGFYDGVKELPADIKADLKALDLTPEKFLGPIGLKTPAGEKDRMLIEQITTRPTAEINGIIGGYTGEGAKTVIPGQGLGQGVVPPGRRAGPGEDPRRLPRLRAGAAAGRLHRSSSAISAWRRRCSCRSTIRRSTRRAPRWPRNGARRR